MLNKKPGKAKLGQRWDRRWCELSDTGYLHYFKKEGGKNAGSVFLKVCTVRVDPDDRNTILLAGEERVYVFQASSEEDASDWARALNFYCK